MTTLRLSQTTNITKKPKTDCPSYYRNNLGGPNFHTALANLKRKMKMGNTEWRESNQSDRGWGREE